MRERLGDAHELLLGDREVGHPDVDQVTVESHPFEQLDHP